MRVSDLIAALQLMPQDLEVYSYTDHGQTAEKSCRPSIRYTDELTHTLESFGAEDEGEDWGLTVPFVIL